MISADDILRVQGQMEDGRAVFQSHWQEVAERVWPDRATFTAKRTEGDKRNEKVFDSTAPLGLTRFGAAMESMISPRTTKWHALRVPYIPYGEEDDTALYLEEVNDILFTVRYGPKANFASQQFECYLSLGAFGNSVMFVEDVPGYGIRYRSIHLAEIYFQENSAGSIDYVHRKFEMTARQALQKFGADALPEKVAESAAKNPLRRFEFIHCVKPSDDVGRFKYDSLYLCTEGRCICEIGGYHTMPYIVGRYITTPGETYGRSPAMLVLPDIKMVNEMAKTFLRAAHLAVSPPLLLQEDGILQGCDMRPGALNFGGVDANGNQVVQPLKTGAQLEVGGELLMERRKVINEAFLISLFQILVDKPYMTASEALLRAQEKGQLLAPTMSRYQSEALGPMIGRELDILGRARMLPPPPPAVVQARGELEIEYVSPLNKMQRADEAVGIMRTLESAVPLIQIDPSIAKVFDTKRMLHILAETNGAPKRIFKTQAELDEADAAEAQMAQAQALLQAAPVVTQSIKTMADANKAAAETPPVLPAPVAAGV